MKEFRFDHGFSVFLRRPFLAALLLASGVAGAQTTADTETNKPSDDPIARIKTEGMEHSQAMETLGYLSDVIGQRLTGSPNGRRASEWTRAKLEGWGLSNAHLEAWGPFGRGWELKHFSAQIVEPQVFPLIACPQSWSPGLDHPVVGDVVYLGAVTTSNLDSYKGKLAGAIVLVSPMHEIAERFDPLASRITESNLLRLANASGDVARYGAGPGGGRRGGGAAGANARPTPGRLLTFLIEEKAAVAVMISAAGDGGTVFVSSATVPTAANAGGGFRQGGPRAWSTNVPASPPQITLAAEDYNRLARMCKLGEKLKMEVDLKVKFYDHDVTPQNTVAEIPGSDLKDEIVMLGGHLDSWQGGTGATDNGVGAVACMEAVRIIQAANLHPRRTIRIALWTGEEEGLLGSRAYVSNHFGYFSTNSGATRSTARRSPRQADDKLPATDAASTNATPTRHLVRGNEYEKLSAYFNLDNGAGKIRGIYMENNEGVRPLFRQWLEPFRSVGAETVTISRTGSTDHVSFDSIGLPGFEFLQDPLDYMTRTHHSNQDVFDRIQADDLKQAATIIAAFVYDAAMLPDKLPRKPVPE